MGRALLLQRLCTADRGPRRTGRGVLVDLPIPGWFGLEVGIALAVANFIEDRHGDSRVLGMLKPEIALTAEFDFFKARLAYQHNVLPIGKAGAAQVADGQFALQA